MSTPKLWAFEVHIRGPGATKEEAWWNAVAALAASTELPPVVSQPKPEGPPNETFNGLTAPEKVIAKCMSDMTDASGVIVPESERLLKALRRIVKLYHAEYGSMDRLPMNPTHWGAAERMAVTAALALNCNQEV